MLLGIIAVKPWYLEVVICPSLQYIRRIRGYERESYRIVMHTALGFL